MNSPITRASIHLSLVAGALAACTNADEIASPDAVSSVSVREAKGTTASYSATAIEPLPGDVTSYAWEVNDASHVAVQSEYYSMWDPRVSRWLIRAGSQNTLLDGTIRGISSGPVTYVAGWSISAVGAAARWTFSPSTGFSGPALLDYAPGSQGDAAAVNDLGDVTGAILYPGSSDAAVWIADGTRIVIPSPNPGVYPSASGTDINNSGDVAIRLGDNAGNYRGGVQTADGVFIELPPLAGHAVSFTKGISERMGTKFYVAGTSDSRNGMYNAVRWTIDIASHSIVATDLRPERSAASDITDDGAVVGDLSDAKGTTGFVWKGTSLVKLNTPNGLSSGRTFSVSGNGKYISGDAKNGSYRKGVLWTAP